MSFWVQQETLGWNFTITVSLPPALRRWENFANPYPESKNGGHGAQCSPHPGTSRYSPCHPRTRGSQCSVKDTVPSCRPEQKLLSKWQSVNIGTSGSSTPGSRLGQMHVAVAWQPPACTTRAPVPTQSGPASAQHLQLLRPRGDCRWRTLGILSSVSSHPHPNPCTSTRLDSVLWAPGGRVLGWWGASASQPSMLSIWCLGVPDSRKWKREGAPTPRVSWPLSRL